jgi:hypothetical protein
MSTFATAGFRFCVIYEFMHMIVKGQMKGDGIGRTPAEQFYSLAM